MEKVKQFLELRQEESERVSRLASPSHIAGVDLTFFIDFVLKGIRVDRVKPDLVVCTFKVPPRLKGLWFFITENSIMTIN
ncbi:hypothetical protein PanWU01x14_222090 [Parasponia andersonii]|uniref:Uncharacterized protein n=1 Tax=Parasponia andersonii TaxID=3476 RepID=A0A2P5BPE7_PARAD|nr:hypothetical protein PanWU01x14_222090 [Parasponia andersonii]